MERQCRHCGSPGWNAKGPPICLSCRNRPVGTGSRPRKRLECPCGRLYTTTGGNRLCASCRHEADKHPCGDCGVPVDRRADVCRPCWGARHKGPKGTRWRGGRTLTKAGYVLVSCPGHPRAQGPTCYVREHALVMEAVIGRYLLPGEEVHHKNGQRDDNRIENLELWAKSQPAGQRAVDLLAWAREIVARYEPVEALLVELPFEAAVAQ